MFVTWRLIIAGGTRPSL